MLRPVRMSMIAISVVFVLLTLQIPVEAKKKSSKRKKRAARSARVVVVVPPIFSPESSDDFTISNAAPALAVAPAQAPAPSWIAQSSPSKGGGMRIEGAGGAKESKSVDTIIKKSKITTELLAGGLMISEFRLQGNGAEDEFIEIYNDFGADHTVVAASGTGYGIAASDGIVRCSIPNLTVIPAKGHFLCVNSDGYSLSTYPAGNGTTATGDATYTTEITDGEDPDGMGPNPPTARQGIALFNNNTGGASFTLANRFDAAGPESEANTLYKEGTGLPDLTLTGNYAWVRDECGKGGSITTMGACSISTPKDTENNAADFYSVDTSGFSARLGAPGPQNLSAPIQRNSSITENLLDASVARSSPPNRVRDFTSDPPNESSFGTLDIRRRFVNNTGASITRLRFRVIDLTTFDAPSGIADLRARTSTLVVVSGINDSAACLASTGSATTPCTVNVQGTTLDVATAPGTGQFNGGAFNSSLSAGTVTVGTPLANGASINLRFLLGIQQTGTFRVYVNIEALP